MPFQDDLARYGPGTERPTAISLDQAKAYCAELTARHYENFSVVTWLTPRALRPAFRSIYSFCRWSDDLGDEVGDPARSLELLEWWRGELLAMFDGQPRHPVMVALAETVEEFAIPIEPFLDLISAFEQDQAVNDYDTFDQLLNYCQRSADPVGHLVLYLGRVFNPENARLSDRTCTGLQLANFWQDVSRDFEIGRIYLPREDREVFGVTTEQLQARRFDQGFARLLQFEVSRARERLEAGRELIDRIPGMLAVDVDLFSRGGMAILDRIEAQGFDVLSSRPEVGRWSKLGLLVRAILARPGRRPTTSRVLAGRVS